MRIVLPSVVDFVLSTIRSNNLHTPESLIRGCKGDYLALRDEPVLSVYAKMQALTSKSNVFPGDGGTDFLIAGDDVSFVSSPEALYEHFTAVLNPSDEAMRFVTLTVGGFHTRNGAFSETFPAIDAPEAVAAHAVLADVLSRIGIDWKAVDKLQRLVQILDITKVEDLYMESISPYRRFAPGILDKVSAALPEVLKGSDIEPFRNALAVSPGERQLLEDNAQHTDGPGASADSLTHDVFMAIRRAVM